ncbi:MAG TPA: radical SAM family heme chaperone HemW [Acidobacteriaceae bacterium]|nr:radical SAM family heme chaperone HemW [Acidobacteriaceae bacterium]
MSATLGLYISVPFCRAKCTYCNFASGVFPASEHGRYVERVCAEIRGARGRAELEGWLLPERAGSVYLGGGTPSTLEPERLREIFAAVRENFTVERDAEITIECAPGQIAPDFLKAMVEVSATRVSLGVQSMVDAEAAATGRMHTRAIVQEDVRRLHDAGLAVNVDLIAGLPGQTMSSWMESVEAVCGLGIEHASLYMLEVDEDSRLGRELIGGGARYGAALVPTDDAVAAMYEAGCERLEQAGLAQYEISNFARRGAESRHNLRYWRREPYLGAGLDAHSMLRHRDGGVVRFGNTDELAGYLAGDTEAEVEVEVERVDRAAELEESWFLGLRLVEGVSLPALRCEFGDDAIAVFDEAIGELVGDGLLMREGDRVALTMRGRMLSNEVFGRFLGVAAELISTEPGELLLPTR